MSDDEFKEPVRIPCEDCDGLGYLVYEIGQDEMCLYCNGNGFLLIVEHYAND